jgi:hypothetical protein
MKNFISLSKVFLILSPMFCYSALAADIQNVLFIGDSHSYSNYGKTVDSYLRKKYEKVTTVGSCGSSPSTWMKSPTHFLSTTCGYWHKGSNGHESYDKKHQVTSLESQLASAKPELTVISLGTNILSSEGDIQREMKHVEKMAQDIKAAGSQCIWVGPPKLKKDPFKSNLASGVKHLKEVLKNNSCEFIDSTELTEYPQAQAGKRGPDGIHYDGAGYQKWGQGAVRELDAILSKPSFQKSPAVNSPAENNFNKNSPADGGVR